MKDLKRIYDDLLAGKAPEGWHLYTDTLGVELVEDEAAKGTFHAVGAQAGVRYKSDRVIPLDIEKAALREAVDEDRQISMMIGHPGFLSDGGVFGDTTKWAAVLDPAKDIRLDEKDGRVHLKDIKPIGAPGALFLSRVADGIRYGVSQRAFGRGHDVQMEDGSFIELMDELHIVGFDFVPLNNANAGDQTEILTDDQIKWVSERTRGDAMPAKDTKDIERIAAENQSLHAALCGITDTFVGEMVKSLGAESPHIPTVIAMGDKVKTDAADVLKSDKPADEKNALLTAMLPEAQKAYDSMIAKVDAPAPKPAAKPEPKPEEKPKPASYVPPTSSVVDDADAWVARLETSRRLGAYLDEALTRQKDLPADTRKMISDSIDIKAMTDEAMVETALKTALSLVDAGKARGDLAARGMAVGDDGKNGGNTPMISDNGTLSDIDKATRMICDSFVGTGRMRSALEDPAMKPVKDQDDVEKRKATRPVLDAMLKKYDEQQMILGEDIEGDAKRVLDASTAGTDLVLPRTILGRLVLEEVFAMEILAAITQLGTLDHPSQQIPIKQWGRSTDHAGSAGFNRSAVPDLFMRGSGIKVAELGAINQAQQRVTYVNIDAAARKLATTMSVEFLARAAKERNLASVAMAIEGLVADIRRSILQELFYDYILKTSLGRGAASFTFDNIAEGVQLCDGTVDTFQLVGAPVAGLDPATAVSIVPDGTLVVKEGVDTSEIAVPQYKSTTTGGGEGAAFFYVIDYAASTVQFVDSAGASSPPPAGKSVLVTAGNKASGERRFDMNPGGVKLEDHFNTLAFLVGDVKALNEAIDNSALNGYDMNVLLASNTTMRSLAHARSYAADGRRRAFGADAPISEGNYGVMDEMSAWGSKVFPSDWIVEFNRDAALFYTYVAMELRGPIPTFDTNGVITGGEQYYAYGEDALNVPIATKIAPPITLYTSA